MQRVVLYGVGSPIVADVQESLERAGLGVAAAVRNFPGRVWLDSPVTLTVEELTAELLALPFLAPFFTPANRQKVVREAFDAGFTQAASLVDPSVPCTRSLVHAAGLYVNAGCTLGAACQFGEFVFVNRGASIGHHVELADFVSIGPGAVLGGLVRMGRGSVVGAGAVVLPEITIGANAVVGAGAVVTKNVPDNALVLGVPARVTRSAIPGYGNQSIQ